uniref:Uncharacterized protein n=1 Tax=Populus alba TaxID=43335 RepID=A0A4U5R1U3_POPAL|nr:hypothetical protein D5086_0000010740 [Populus alba]
MTTSSLPANLLLAEEIPKNYPSSVNFEDWIDRTRQSQNVRVRFIPPEKKEIHELGSNRRGRKIVVSFPFQFDKSFTFWQMKALSLGILNFFDGFLLNAENCRRKKTISLLSTDLHLQTATIAIANGRSCTLTVTVEKISQSA